MGHLIHPGFHHQPHRPGTKLANLRSGVCGRCVPNLERKDRETEMGLSENVGYIPNEIAIFHRDNDQQNHWVQWGTQHFQTNPNVVVHENDCQYQYDEVRLEHR